MRLLGPTSSWMSLLKRQSRPLLSVRPQPAAVAALLFRLKSRRRQPTRARRLLPSEGVRRFRVAEMTCFLIWGMREQRPDPPQSRHDAQAAARQGARQEAHARWSRCRRFPRCRRALRCIPQALGVALFVPPLTHRIRRRGGSVRQRRSLMRCLKTTSPRSSAERAASPPVRRYAML